jgi:hypothetical protein
MTYNVIIIPYICHVLKLNLLGACYRRVSFLRMRSMKNWFEDKWRPKFWRSSPISTSSIPMQQKILSVDLLMSITNITVCLCISFFLVHMHVEVHEISLFMWFPLNLHLFLYITTTIKSWLQPLSPPTSSSTHPL